MPTMPPALSMIQRWLLHHHGGVPGTQSTRWAGSGPGPNELIALQAADHILAVFVLCLHCWCTDLLATRLALYLLAHGHLQNNGMARHSGRSFCSPTMQIALRQQRHQGQLWATSCQQVALAAVCSAARPRRVQPPQAAAPGAYNGMSLSCCLPMPTVVLCAHCSVHLGRHNA